MRHRAELQRSNPSETQSTDDHQHKMKLKIKDLRKLYEGEPSDEMAPINISDEEMAKKLEAEESYYYPNCKKSHSLNLANKCIKQPKFAIATQKLREEIGGALSLVATSEERRKRMDNEELPAAKVAKTFGGCLKMRPMKQMNIASTSSATASGFYEYKTSDPHEELCKHEAAFTLCLLKKIPIKTRDDKFTTSSDDDLYNLHLLARVCEGASNCT